VDYKKIGAAIILDLITVYRSNFSLAALASEITLAEPINFMGLKKFGLSSETIGRYLA
jgi:hypothetical protein